jgi:hypothetical protein
MACFRAGNHAMWCLLVAVVAAGCTAPLPNANVFADQQKKRTRLQSSVTSSQAMPLMTWWSSSPMLRVLMPQWPMPGT